MGLTLEVSYVGQYGVLLAMEKRSIGRLSSPSAFYTLTFQGYHSISAECRTGSNSAYSLDSPTQ
jgi:hypothetical protein